MGEPTLSNFFYRSKFKVIFMYMQLLPYCIYSYIFEEIYYGSK